MGVSILTPAPDSASPIDAEILQTFGIAGGQAFFTTVVEFAGSKRADADNYDTAIFRNLMFWNGCYVALRNGLIPLGWTTSRYHGFEYIRSPGSNIAIAVATASDAGSQVAIPITHEKGMVTQLAVGVSQTTGYLFAEAEAEDRRRDPFFAMETWFLLVNSTPNEIGFEISLPLGMDERRRRITTWKRRLRFSPLRLDANRTKSPSRRPDSKSVEVVRRKKE